MSKKPSVSSFKELKDLISIQGFSDIINGLSNSDVAFVGKNDLPSTKVSVKGSEKITKDFLKDLGFSSESSICAVEPNEEPLKTNVEWYKNVKDNNFSEKLSKINVENSTVVKKNKLK